MPLDDPACISFIFSGTGGFEAEIIVMAIEYIL